MVAGCHVDPRRRAFVQLLVDLGQRLKVQVIANGVMAADQIAPLAGLGVTGFTGPGVTVLAPDLPVLVDEVAVV